METLTVNLTGQTRRETFNGRDYIVAPLSLIVPGVLHGNQGPIYYPQDEVEHEPERWNHVPIVVDHPYKDGSPISARTPEVLNEKGIGYVFSAKAKGKLTAEGWFDVEKTKQVDDAILNAIQTDRPIELSTGLVTDNHPVNNDGTNMVDGKPYQFIARNYRPDHLAILPDKTGACSLKDGCGVLVNEDKGEKGWIKKIAEKLGISTNELSHDQQRMQLQKELNARFTQDDPMVWIDDVFDGYFIYCQENKKFKMGYSSSENGVKLTGEPIEVLKKIDYVSVANSGDSFLQEKEPDMATEAKLTDNQKAELVDNLIANCNCWDKSDREGLLKFNDDKLKSLMETAEKEGKEGKGVPAATDPPAQAQTTNANGEKPEDKPTFEALLNAASPEVRETFRHATEIVTNEKNKLVERLVENASTEEAKTAARTVYSKLGIDELKPLVNALPEKTEPGQNLPGQLPPNYFGAAAPTTNAAPDDDDVLPLPTINWAEESAA